MSCGFVLNKTHSGFTLVELMVTIAVVAIVATIAVPSFNGLVQGNRLSGATNQLVSAFHLARSEAIKRSQNVSLCATSDGINCTPRADWNSWLVLAGNEVILQGRVSSGLNVAGPANTNIIFSSAGLVRDNAGAGLSSSLQVCSTSGALTENTRTMNFVAGGSISINKGVSTCG
ncbi:GspH/FimT family pseudopilin [Arsukibacterium sp.]|uniref:GspH/FimT family pseudopilin n=1 Tax=Arsukibacterium sp. TaxID=1977258 RepID=UPI00299E313D|nr:GspH/FimT family pseudopilin [Arsukibacterium sp.]MDX1678496.1 GspH/FimT family pseudopilin [Arsukibacterium sp.]